MTNLAATLDFLISQSKQHSINPTKLPAVREVLTENANTKNIKTKNWNKIFKCLLIALALPCLYNYYVEELSSRRCFLQIPRTLGYAFRPAEKCDFCRKIEQVARVQDISAEEFARKYAYSGMPVVVTDATKNWTASEVFNYWYFRNIYHNAKRRQKILDCQFLPYKTGFRDIYEALDMPAARVELQNNTKPWYFGWSNCNPETAEIFRRHYGRPYFLPATSENNAVDWFFIGTAGLGAHMHIDNVRLPSWQAQLQGSKRWLLVPPPECYFECKRFEVVVERGDMIVLDTNRWYHQTFVQPGQLSLTIGAEYD